MHVAFDFGISNTDLAIFQRESTHFHSFPTDTKDLTNCLLYTSPSPRDRG